MKFLLPFLAFLSSCGQNSAPVHPKNPKPSILLPSPSLQRTLNIWSPIHRQVCAPEKRERFSVFSNKGLVVYGLHDHTFQSRVFSSKKPSISPTQKESRTIQVYPKELTHCGVEATTADGLLEKEAWEILKVLAYGEHFYHTLPSARPLAPLDVHLFPIHEVSIELKDQFYHSIPTKVHYVQADNLDWRLQERGSRNIFSLTIYPQSLKAQKEKLYSGVPLWKIPQALLHEYYHHVFFHFLGTTSHNKSWVILNEAFADLFSFYALNRPSLSAYTCLAKNREVHIGEFSNGVPKALTPRMLRNYFANRPSQSAQNPCPMLRDGVHEYTLSSIVAYEIQKTFAERHPSSSSSQIAELLLMWLKNLQLIDFQKSPDKVLLEALKLVGEKS